MSVVSVVCCQVEVCDGLITRPEESYRLWRGVVCDLETSRTRRLKARYRAVKIQSQWVVTPGKQTNISEENYQSVSIKGIQCVFCAERT